MFGKKEEYVLHERKFKKRKKPEKEAAAPVAEESADVWESGRNTAGAVTIAELLAEDAPPTEKEEMPIKIKKAPFYKRRKTVGGLLIGASLVITMLVSPALSYLTQRETSTVVVATVEIRKGDAIQDSMIKETTVSAGSVLPIQKLDMTAVTGKYAKSDITMGEILSSPKISNELPFDNAYLYTLPTGKKAMSVSVGKLSSDVSGKLESGDVISVYVLSGESNNDIRFAAQQPPELSYVEVLSTTNADGVDVTVPPEQSKLENPLPTTVTLAVDDIQSVILAGSEAKGGVHLALVTRGGENAAKLLETQSAFNLEVMAALKAEQAKQAEMEAADTAAPGEVVKIEK